MKRSNSLFSCALNGIGIGIPVTLVCMTLIGGWNGVIREFLIWTAASALFGICTGVVFSGSERLNLPSAMAIHCGLCLIIAIAAAALIGYSDSLLELVKAIVPVFVIVYTVIYGGSLLSMKRQERKINEALEE